MPDYADITRRTATLLSRFDFFDARWPLDDEPCTLIFAEDAPDHTYYHIALHRKPLTGRFELFETIL